MTANELLNQAVSEMADRAVTYDNSEGERSIPKTVEMFNTLTGHNLTYTQGWLFMTCLKMVRCQQGSHKQDNFVDGAAYMALAGESAASEFEEVEEAEVINLKPKRGRPRKG